MDDAPPYALVINTYPYSEGGVSRRRFVRRLHHLRVVFCLEKPEKM